MGKFIKNNLPIIITLLFITPLGFYLKLYDGIFKATVNDRVVDAVYVFFWILVFKLFSKKIKNYKIVLIVFFITSALEFLQLWHPPFLEYIRKFFLGRTLLGTNFVPEDFLYYIIGAATGYLYLLFIDNNR